jgi:hypothetical protein
MEGKKLKVSENRNYYTSMTGEFYVLAQLFQREYMASLTYGNAKSVDIFVSTKSGSMFKIEVKTTGKGYLVGSDKSQFGKNYEWQMSQGHEDKQHKDLYYCFVILTSEKELPKFFIVRSAEVAEYVKREHLYWLGLKRKKTVQDNERRIFRIGLTPKSHGLPIEKYENKWDILPR